jgi:protein-S-isoprenylcysteine O-methyltransferase Ste14
MSTIRQELTPEVKAGISKRIVQIVVVFVFEAAILFLSAGRFDWLWAWVLLLLYMVGVLVNASFMLRYNPETIARRASAEGVKGWDRIVSGLWALMGIVQLIVAGLDIRNSWSEPLALAVHILSATVYTLGFALFSWAMISNAYFATVVRVQQDRGHRVCTSGPYRFVRHPGYVGAILQSLALPFLLGSIWALIPGIVSACILVVRTALEDRTLRQELPGYSDYAEQVRFRLLPGVW